MMKLVRECFYLPEGSFVPHWRERPLEHFCNDRYRRAFNTGYAGKPAGTDVRSDGRRRITFSMGGRPIRIYAYCVVWALTHGAWPTNDAPENLREATRAQNARNISMPSHNTSGFKGVSWRQDKQKYRAYIKVDGRYIHLGHFDKREDASSAYQVAAAKHFGEFVRGAA